MIKKKRETVIEVLKMQGILERAGLDCFISCISNNKVSLIVTKWTPDQLSDAMLSLYKNDAVKWVDSWMGDFKMELHIYLDRKDWQDKDSYVFGG